MSDLKAQAEALGIEVDGRWSDDTIRQKIADAGKIDPTPDAHPLEQVEPREKSLHELNMEARRIDRSLRGLNTEAGEAAKNAVVGVLDARRPDGKRTTKPHRPI